MLEKQGNGADVKGRRANTGIKGHLSTTLLGVWGPGIVTSGGMGPEPMRLIRICHQLAHFEDQGGFASRSIMETIAVIIWILEVVDMLTEGAWPSTHAARAKP